jgi:hypothetical protein
MPPNLRQKRIAADTNKERRGNDANVDSPRYRDDRSDQRARFPTQLLSRGGPHPPEACHRFEQPSSPEALTQLEAGTLASKRHPQ